MSKPFDRLRNRLLSAGVAPRYVGRYVTELNEHLADATSAGEREGITRRKAEAAGLARMGSLDDLADAMIARPELQSWVARRPWAAFLIAPLLALLIVIAVGLAALVLIVQLYRPAPMAPAVLPIWFGGLRAAIFGLDRYLLPVIVGWAITIMAFRQRISLLWPILGMVAISLIGGAIQIAMELPTTPGSHGEISFGFGLLPPFAEFPGTLARVVSNLLLTLSAYLILRQRIGGTA